MDETREQLHALESQIETYRRLKRALAIRSDPLAECVVSILTERLSLCVRCEETYIEDGVVVDADNEVLAVLEIKGVNGSFTRQNINQVDSHRERLGLTPETPGLLIMNTKMIAKSLDEKDEGPHPDIIQKAVQDNVLLVRTLDLLRLVDLVERELIAKDEFRSTFLRESGWLKVQGEAVRVVKD